MGAPTVPSVCCMRHDSSHLPCAPCPPSRSNSFTDTILTSPPVWCRRRTHSSPRRPPSSSTPLTAPQIMSCPPGSTADAAGASFLGADCDRCGREGRPSSGMISEGSTSTCSRHRRGGDSARCSSRLPGPQRSADPDAPAEPRASTGLCDSRFLAAGAGEGAAGEASRSRFLAGRGVSPCGDALGSTRGSSAASSFTGLGDGEVIISSPAAGTMGTVQSPLFASATLPSSQCTVCITRCTHSSSRSSYRILCSPVVDLYAMIRPE
mmetsp:Transcript_20773/g.45519  ORF Transcript_20773/g.45519 Transcript_20773/m.45519 type:complete len:265 (-) Transcript_20773:596-1390(-)